MMFRPMIYGGLLLAGLLGLSACGPPPPNPPSGSVDGYYPASGPSAGYYPSSGPPAGYYPSSETPAPNGAAPAPQYPGYAPPPGAAYPQSPQGNQPSRPLSACRSERQQFCGMVQPGGGRLVQCLRSHEPSLSPGCREALMALRGARSGGAPPYDQTYAP
jgi:hypothetical protein